MSAYALPGSFFPPISGATFESSYMSLGETSKSEYAKPFGPQHQQSPISSPFQFKPVSFSSMCSSPISADSPLTPLPKAAPVEGLKSSETNTAKEVGISVKEAKIDPVRLVKSIASKAKGYKQNTTPQSSPSVQVTQSECISDDDPHTEAIQFELSISFNGRTYTATRTMPRIIQLRNDLITEIKARRMGLRGKRIRLFQKRNFKPMGRTDFGAVVDDDDITVETVGVDDEEGCVSIPEIPEYCSEEERAGSFAGKGFTLLHALLRSYCPAMESWLRKVTDLIPPTDSPSLSKFLWEPVSGEVHMSSSHSFSTLVSIKEDESEEEESEDSPEVKPIPMTL